MAGVKAAEVSAILKDQLAGFNAQASWMRWNGITSG